MSKFLKEKCQCCGNKTIKKKLSLEVSDIFLCEKSCIYSRPNVNTNALYSPEYFKVNYETRKEAQKATSHKICYFLKKHISSGSILDYGCGIGSFLHESEKLGFKENTGIDVSEYSISLAQSVAKNSNFFLEKDYSETKKFDCISMIDSLAHIENINLTLPNIIKNNLKPNGFLLIRTPNINRAYLFYILLIRYFFPKKYQASLFFAPHRLFLFNKKSIKLFLQKYDFELLDILYEPDYKNNQSLLKNTSIKLLIDQIIRIKVPSLINRNNSMTIIAQLKKC